MAMISSGVIWFLFLVWYCKVVNENAQNNDTSSRSPRSRALVGAPGKPGVGFLGWLANARARGSGLCLVGETLRVSIEEGAGRLAGKARAATEPRNCATPADNEFENLSIGGRGTGGFEILIRPG
jgi:hypothetical protein